jgi:hydrogenase maturation factor
MLPYAFFACTRVEQTRNVRFRPGKLNPELLAELLRSNTIRDERVVIRPAVGRDVCVISMGDRYLVATTDPITFATDRIGWYVVQVNANDLATVGARPRWFLATVLLPECATDEALVREIWGDLQQALRSIDCDLCGGHTEITIGLDRPILVGQMLGEVEPERFVDKASARAGDRVLLTKGVPVEGTAIMAREKDDELARHFPPEVIRRARDYLDDPGISVVKEAMAACEAGGVHAMHDPTEGGVATGLWELAQATGLGLRVEARLIPILEPGGALCRHFGMDPLGTISSGSLLICVAPESAGAVQMAVEACGVACVEIGEMLRAGEGVTLVRDGAEAPMPTFPQDEITKLWRD